MNGRGHTLTYICLRDNDLRCQHALQQIKLRLSQVRFELYFVMRVKASKCVQAHTHMLAYASGGMHACLSWCFFIHVCMLACAQMLECVCCDETSIDGKEETRGRVFASSCREKR